MASARRDCWSWERGAKGSAGVYFPASFGIKFTECMWYSTSHAVSQRQEFRGFSKCVPKAPLVNWDARGLCRGCLGLLGNAPYTVPGHGHTWSATAWVMCMEKCLHQLQKLQNQFTGRQILRFLLEKKDAVVWLGKPQGGWFLGFGFVLFVSITTYLCLKGLSRDKFMVEAAVVGTECMAYLVSKKLFVATYV